MYTKHINKACIILLLTISITCSGQIGIKIMQFRPAGDLGATMKKTVTGEIMRIKSFDDNLRIRFGFSFAILKPRLDTFPVYLLDDNGDNIMVYPGYKVFRKYNMYSFYGGMDYRLIKIKKLSFYPGIDMILGGIDMNYEYSTIIENESFSGGEILVGIRFRFGADYSISETTGIFAELNRSFYNIQEQGGFSHNDIGLGFRFKL